MFIRNKMKCLLCVCRTCTNMRECQHACVWFQGNSQSNRRVFLLFARSFLPQPPSDHVHNFTRVPQLKQYKTNFKDLSQETLTFPHGDPESDEKKQAGVGRHGSRWMEAWGRRLFRPICCGCLQVPRGYSLILPPSCDVTAKPRPRP